MTRSLSSLAILAGSLWLAAPIAQAGYGFFNNAGSFVIVNKGGAGSGLQVNLGIFAEQSLNLLPTNLRTGGFASLIAQDASGAFLLSIDDAGAVTTTGAALEQLGDHRASLGAVQSRLEFVAEALTVESENLGSALSRISDADVASETTQLTRYNLIADSSNSMIAQANQAPASVIRLLQS